MSTIRLKMTVTSVKHCAAADGGKYAEEITLSAVYGPEGSVNAQWSTWTPSASLTMQINNSAAFDKVLPGQFMFVDLTPTTRDAA